MGITLMVACLGSFRQLYINKQEKSKKGYVKPGLCSLNMPRRWGFLSAIRPAFKRSSTSHSDGTSSSRGILYDLRRAFGSSSQKSTRLVDSNPNSSDNPKGVHKSDSSDPTSYNHSQVVTAHGGPSNSTLTSGWTMPRTKFIDGTLNDSHVDDVDDPLYAEDCELTLLKNIHIKRTFDVESASALSEYEATRAVALGPAGRRDAELRTSPHIARLPRTGTGTRGVGL